MTVNSAKFLITAALASLPLGAAAQDLSPDSARILSDPNYLPVQGELWGYTDYSHTFTNGTSYDHAGDELSSFHVNADDIGQYFGYGITDDFAIDASIHYQPDIDRKIDRVAAGATMLDSTGFTDPTFGATFRVLDQRTSPVTLDVFGTYTPDAFDAKSPSPVADGLVASGGQSGTVGAALAEEMRQFTVRGAFDANFQGADSIEDAATGALNRLGYRTNYDVSLETQTRLNDQFSVNGNFYYTFDNNATFTNGATGVSSLDHPGNDAAFEARLNYHFVPNTVVGTLVYRYDTHGDGWTQFADPTLDTSTRSRSSNLVGVQLSYVLP